MFLVHLVCHVYIDPRFKENEPALEYRLPRVLEAGANIEATDQINGE
jgi:hypothetical protein